MDLLLRIGIHEHYAYDFVSGKPQGPWYAFNDQMLFKAMVMYAGLQGPQDVLASSIAGKTVLEWMDYLANYWRGLTGTEAAPPCASVAGTWDGFWVHGHRRCEGVAKITQVGRTLALTYSGTGWDHGVGTLFPNNTVTVALYSGTTIHARLEGVLYAGCGGILWDNDSVWCLRSGVGPASYCAAPRTPWDWLADYGGASNLLECVPTYVHKVPALNAANAWMMREVAAVVNATNASYAMRLRADAANVSAAVRNLLYVNRSGYFACGMPDRTVVSVRHIIDFVTVAPALRADLGADVASAMCAFVQRELRTPTWLRALSLQDSAAAHSDRKDHGPFGSYDGWLGELLEAFAALGRYDLAIAAVRRMAVVYNGGPGGQSHQVLGMDTPESSIYRGPARKADADQQYFAMSGSVPANRVLTALFGLHPDLLGGGFLRDPHVPRPYNATLRNVRIQGALYDIVAGSRGLALEKAKPFP